MLIKRLKKFPKFISSVVNSKPTKQLDLSQKSSHISFISIQIQNIFLKHNLSISLLSQLYNPTDL